MLQRIYRHLKRKSQLWRRRQQLPGWIALPREPNLSVEEVVAGRAGFHEMRPAAWSSPAVSLPPSVHFLSRREKSWSQVEPRLIPALGCFVIPDAICGGEGYVYQSGRLGRDVLTMPTEWCDQTRAVPEAVSLWHRESSVKVVDRPLLWFISRGYNSYGHWWLDLVPRLFLLHQDRPEWLQCFAVAIPDDLADWARASLAKLFDLDASRLVEYSVPNEEFLTAPFVVVPTMMHRDHHFHPSAGEFYSTFLQAKIGLTASQIPTLRYVFLSRGNMPLLRVAENHQEVEELFKEEGFAVVAPESLSWEEQIALFQNVELVAGEHGSAMKNVLFAPARTVQLVINYLNSNQATIAAMKQQPCLILGTKGFDSQNYNVPYRVDLKQLRQAIAHAKALAI